MIISVVAAEWLNPPWSHGFTSYALGFIKSLKKLSNNIEIIPISSINKGIYRLSQAEDLESFLNVLTELKRGFFLSYDYAFGEGSIRLSAIQFRLNLGFILGIITKYELTKDNSKFIVHVMPAHVYDLITMINSSVISRCYHQKVLYVPHFITALNSTTTRVAYKIGIQGLFPRSIFPAYSSSYVMKSLNLGIEGVIIPPAIDVAVFKRISWEKACDIVLSRIKAEQRLLEWDYIILHMGFLSATRMYGVQILKALYILRREYKMHVGLMVIGKGKNVNELKQLKVHASKLGLEEALLVNYKYLSTTEKVAVYSLASVLVNLIHPTSPNPVPVDPPITILEALACETPVVSTKAFSIPRVVVNDTTGYTLNNINPSSIAEALSKAIQDRAKLGANGRSIIIGNFSIDAVSKRLKSMYEVVETLG